MQSPDKSSGEFFRIVLSMERAIASVLYQVGGRRAVVLAGHSAAYATFAMAWERVVDVSGRWDLAQQRLVAAICMTTAFAVVARGRIHVKKVLIRRKLDLV